MELWIRSQHKANLVKTTRLEIVKKDKYEIWENDIVFLGEYKTHKRALEILDEIQNMICPKEMINLGQGTIVYEMPEE